MEHDRRSPLISSPTALQIRCAGVCVCDSVYACTKMYMHGEICMGVVRTCINDQRKSEGQLPMYAL